MVIQNSDIGNSAEIVDRHDYITKVDNTLLNFTVNQEKQADKFHEKTLEANSMTEKSNKLLKPVQFVIFKPLSYCFK